jgi:MFS family permease
MLLLAAVINGIGFGALQSSGQTIAVKSAPPHRTGLATATFFLFADVGVGVGPLLAGLIITSLGYRGTFGVLAAVVAACLLLYYALHGHWSHPASARGLEAP